MGKFADKLYRRLTVVHLNKPFRAQRYVGILLGCLLINIKLSWTGIQHIGIVYPGSHISASQGYYI